MFALLPSPQTFMHLPRSRPCIKVLDLLTNRYHAGIVHAASDEALDVELPLSARLRPGQRVHFALDDPHSAVVPRLTMRSALVRRVRPTPQASLRIALTALVECAAA